MKVKEDISRDVSRSVSTKTLNVVNKLNTSKKTILAESRITGSKSIAWSGGAIPNQESFQLDPDDKLTIRIEDAAGLAFDELGYVEFPAWAEFDFKGNHDCPGGQTPQISVTRSTADTRITIQKGKADFNLDLWFSAPLEAGTRGDENVNVGDDQD